MTPTPLHIEIEALRKQNEDLKALIKEGKDIFSFLNDTLGLEKAAQSNFFAAKMAGIISKVQKNPELIDKVAEYLNKLQKAEI